MSQNTGYSVPGYSGMVLDQGRMAAYVRALRSTIRPGCVVLDIGTGTGIFACLACQSGARRVYAVEPDNAIQVAREIAVANGYRDRIEFIQDLSTRINLPERANVVVSDLRGVLPLFQHHVPAIVDARNRHLAPDGVMIPQRDTLWIAAVEVPDLWHEHAGPSREESFGIDMRPASAIALNSWRKASTKPEQILTDAVCLATLDYMTLTNPDLRAEAIVTTHRSGVVHGLAVWFDTVLATNISFSNAPGAPELIYGRAFFPLPEPVDVAVGVKLAVSLAANLVGEDYIWRWDTTIFDGEQIRTRFRQSTFFGAPLSPAQLHKRGAHYVPSLNDDGHIRQYILDAMDCHTALGDIAQALAGQYPARFASWQEALAMVADLSQKYSR